MRFRPDRRRLSAPVLNGRVINWLGLIGLSGMVGALVLIYLDKKIPDALLVVIPTPIAILGTFLQHERSTVVEDLKSEHTDIGGN